MKLIDPPIILLAMLLVLTGCTTSSPDPDPEPVSNKFSEAGWSRARLDDAFLLAENFGTCTLIVMTHGKTIQAMGDIDKPHRVHSIRKALLSALVGQHVGAGPGQIDLDATLETLGIDDRPDPLTPLQRQATVLHLIKSISGINHAAAGETLFMATQKRRRLGEAPNVPGTVWAYNNWDYNVLTTIFEKTTRQSIHDAFLSGIARPLGMRDFASTSVFYVKAEEQSVHAKAGFRLSARDLAKFGQLYLNKGMWDGKAIIPQAWIERITTDYRQTDEPGIRSGHGYLWWVPCDQRSASMGIPEETFVASGFAGQRIVVIPAWDTVIVHTVRTDDYFGFCSGWAEQRGFTLDQAVDYSRTKCRTPAHKDEPFCRRCRYYTGGDFHRLLEKIILARSR